MYEKYRIQTRKSCLSDEGGEKSMKGIWRELEYSELETLNGGDVNPSKSIIDWFMNMFKR